MSKKTLDNGGGNYYGKSSLGHMPPSRWVFDNSVADVFTDMLIRSIPNYNVMREAIFEIGSRCIQPQSYIVDLGCSNGESLEPFIKHFKGNNCYIGVDYSGPMLNAARNRFSEEISQGLVKIDEIDLRRSYPSSAASLTLSILTLQFIPMEYRQRILREVYSNTLANGAFLLVEKVIGESDRIDELMVDRYEKMKLEAGYSNAEIEQKKISLESVLVPLKASWNEQLLYGAGFENVDCFWRCINFAGWIAIK